MFFQDPGGILIPLLSRCSCFTFFVRITSQLWFVHPQGCCIPSCGRSLVRALIRCSDDLVVQISRRFKCFHSFFGFSKAASTEFSWLWTIPNQFCQCRCYFHHYQSYCNPPVHAGTVRAQLASWHPSEPCTSLLLRTSISNVVFRFSSPSNFPSAFDLQAEREPASPTNHRMDHAHSQD